MATTVSHRLPTPQDQAIADLTGYEDGTENPKEEKAFAAARPVLEKMGKKVLSLVAFEGH